MDSHQPLSSTLDGEAPGRTSSSKASADGKEGVVLAELRTGERSASGADEAAVRAARPYRVYRRRFTGCTAIVLLNIGAALSWSWFGPIATDGALCFLSSELPIVLIERF